MNETEILNPLKSAEVVTMPKDEALEKFKEYRLGYKRSRRTLDKMMAQTYKALSEGQGVINVAVAVKQAGVHPETWLPKLAIMRADQRGVWFKRTSNGGAAFVHARNGNWNQIKLLKKLQAERLQFVYPEGTLPPWDKAINERPATYWHDHEAPLPVIPPLLRPQDALSHYCILWEVEKWEPREPPVDPMLLRHIGTTGLYAVVAHWDLTDVERMVLGGLLGR